MGQALIPAELIRALQESQMVTVLTGSGVSAESGIPTFRDALSGLWSQFRPEELATPEAFEHDPEKVTRWYDQRRTMCLGCEPNAGHAALTTLGRIVQNQDGRFALITQNVDRLHQRSGSHGVVELHGSLFVWRCISCHRNFERLGTAFKQFPPPCTDCRGALRPGVVWFGETLPAEVFDAAQCAASDCDLFFSVGTSSQVYPAAGLIELALESGAKVVEVNTQPTPMSERVHWSLRGSAATLLPSLVETMQGRTRRR